MKKKEGIEKKKGKIEKSSVKKERKKEKIEWINWEKEEVVKKKIILPKYLRSK